jgi:uncharacterized protein
MHEDLPAAPLQDQGRIRSLDILRGVAVLGIFVMNSRNFALPLEQFDNPAFPGKSGSPAQAADLWTWAVANILFEDKMIAIFSMLFGAGIVLQAERIARGLRAAAIHYRRMFWLLVIGLAHMFGVWYGDILTTYAVCGMVVYPFRRLRAPLLIGLGVLVLTASMWVRVGPRMIAVLDPQPPAAKAVEMPSTPTPTAEPIRARIWRESLANEEAAYRGSYLDLFRWRARLNLLWNGLAGLDFSLWRSIGFMFLGMGLVTVFSGWRPSVEWGLLIGGYAAGLILISLGFWPQLARVLGRAPQASAEARQMLGSIAGTIRFLGAACLALGHVGMILLLCRVAILRMILAPLAAAGRMALSNYLMQTVIGVIVFDGWALGNWARWGMSEIAILVGCVWIAQLILSPIWLLFFRFGPAEWLWRSLTYWKIQPLRAGTS